MLYLPVAPPGAGKSYLAHELIQRGVIEEHARVCPDTYREILTGDRANQKANGPVFEIVDSIVNSRISNGLDVYLDATNLNFKLRNKLIHRLTFLDPDLYVCVIVSDESRETLERWNKNRSHPVPDFVFERFWGLSEAFNADTFINARVTSGEVKTFREMLEKEKS